MGKSTVSVPISARPAVTPPKGVTAKTPTVVINTSTQPRSPRRWAFRNPDRIEIGGSSNPHYTIYFSIFASSKDCLYPTKYHADIICGIVKKFGDSANYRYLCLQRKRL